MGIGTNWWRPPLLLGLAMVLALANGTIANGTPRRGWSVLAYWGSSTPAVLWNLETTVRRSLHQLAGRWDWVSRDKQSWLRSPKPTSLTTTRCVKSGHCRPSSPHRTASKTAEINQLAQTRSAQQPAESWQIITTCCFYPLFAGDVCYTARTNWCSDQKRDFYVYQYITLG